MYLFVFFSVMFEKLTRNGNKTKYFLFIGIVCAAILLYLLYCGLSKPNSRLNSSSTWWLPSKTWVPYSYRKFREKVSGVRVDVYHIALRMAKTQWSFDRSEYNRVMYLQVKLEWIHFQEKQSFSFLPPF